MRLDLLVTLRASGAGALAAWTVDCRFTGTVATVGQRVLPAVVNRQARLVLEAAAG